MRVVVQYVLYYKICFTVWFTVILIFPNSWHLEKQNDQLSFNHEKKMICIEFILINCCLDCKLGALLANIIREQQEK